MRRGTVISPNVAEIARHLLFPHGTAGQRSEQELHRPAADSRQHEAILRERFTELGPTAVRFFDGVLREQRQGKCHAGKVLALLGTYARADLLAALDRAVRFGAYSVNAVERVLAAQAQPKSILDTLAEHERRHLPAHLRDNPVPPRPTADYGQATEESADGPPPESHHPTAAAGEPREDNSGRPA